MNNTNINNMSETMKEKLKDIDKAFIELNNKKDILSVFSNNALFNGRMISHSKSFYRKKYPYNKVVFNAKIKLEKEIDKKGFIWWGDIDLSLEGDILKKIAKELNEVLHVYYESSYDSSESMWNTNEKTPIITPEIIKEIKKQQAKEQKESKIRNKKRLEDAISINNKLPLVEPKEFLGCKIIKKVKINFEELLKGIEESKKALKIKGYYSADYFEKMFNFDMDKNRITKYWISEETNKRLKVIDIKAENHLRKRIFKEKDFKREVSSNLCLIDIFLANKENVNIKSFKSGYIYVLER
jgi:hypothetical protein